MARVIGWGLAWQRGVTHLPFGIGAGQGVMQQDRLGIGDPHNFYLTLFSEGGPLSLALWLWMFAALWRKAGALARAPGTSAAGTALQGTVALAMFNACIEPTFPGNLYQTLFWWLAGTFYGADPAAERPRGNPES
jgi:O-antigen ligase